MRLTIPCQDRLSLYLDLFSSCATVLHAGRVRASVVSLSIFLRYHTNFDLRNSAILDLTGGLLLPRLTHNSHPFLFFSLEGRSFLRSFGSHGTSRGISRYTTGSHKISCGISRYTTGNHVTSHGISENCYILHPFFKGTASGTNQMFY